MAVVPLNDTLTSVPMSLLVIQGNLDESTELLRHLQDTDQEFALLRCVDTLTQGIKALQDEAYDAVLLDLNLSDSKGLATLIKLRNESNNVSIIVLIHADEEGIGLQALQNGAQDYVVKDAPRSGVHTKTNTICDRAQTR